MLMRIPCFLIVRHFKSSDASQTFIFAYDSVTETLIPESQQMIKISELLEKCPVAPHN
jgi:hypothetical protein